MHLPQAPLSFIAPSLPSHPSRPSHRPHLLCSHASPDHNIYFATCARGLGRYLAAEIRRAPICGDVMHVAASGVRFRAREAGHVTGYRACLWLRTAMRVLLQVAQAEVDEKAQVSEAVYDVVRRGADWGWILEGGRKTFSVQARMGGGGERMVQTVAKNAICDALRSGGFAKPERPVSHAGADVPVFVAVGGGWVTVYLDMAGGSLHKRGYRDVVHKAALNESVAAGMVYMGGSDVDVVVDPMCGSGTLLIEAALIRLNVAVGLYRREFGFMRWRGFDGGVWREVVGEAVGLQRGDGEVGVRLVGNDVDERALRLARRGIERTRLGGVVELRGGCASEVEVGGRVLVVCNPGWGKRLEGGWGVLGGVLRKWEGEACLLSGFRGGGVGLKVREKVPVRIGDVDCRVLIYDLWGRGG